VTLTDHPRLVALLRAILADPSCDATRLIYADALDELGDGDRAAQERAEFIRLQVELANIMAAPSSARNVTLKWCGGAAECRWRPTCLVHELRRREAELLSPDPLGPPSGVPWCWMGAARAAVPGGAYWVDHVTFRRGFVEGLTMPAAELPRLDAVRACQPVTRVTLLTWPDSAELAALTIRRGKQPGVADTEETGATRWCLKRLWPGIEWALPGGRAAVT
jgi:uncharacterized protein (TIGR02996 family)